MATKKRTTSETKGPPGKPARKPAKSAAKLAPPPPGAREAALVDAVIASVRAGNDVIEVPVAELVPAEVLAKLRFSDGSLLPPSLARWLAFDGGWLARTFGWDFGDGVLKAFTVEEIVRDDLESADVWAPLYRELPAPMTRGRALPLDAGTESIRFLFLAAPDVDGEYPVLWLDVGNMPVVGVQAPGFDVWRRPRWLRRRVPYARGRCQRQHVPEAGASTWTSPLKTLRARRTPTASAPNRASVPTARVFGASTSGSTPQVTRSFSPT